MNDKRIGVVCTISPELREAIRSSKNELEDLIGQIVLKSVREKAAKDGIDLSRYSFQIISYIKNPEFDNYDVTYKLIPKE